MHSRIIKTLPSRRTKALFWLVLVAAGYLSPLLPRIAAADPVEWTLVGPSVKASSSIFADVDSSRHASNPSLAFAGDRLYLAWLEPNNRGVPQVYVRHWNGSAWIKDGESQNTDVMHRAYDLTFSSNGDVPYLAWIELDDKKIAQLHLKHLTGNQWIIDGESLNLNASQPAANPSLAFNGSTPILAWSESDSNRVFHLYAKRQVDGQWHMIGDGPLNVSLLHDAIEPSIAFEETALYAAWMELSDQGFYQIRVKRWDGSQWEPLGGPLNINPSSHAMRPSVALRNRIPSVAWIEIDASGVAQFYVKSWDQDRWTSPRESLNADRTQHSLSPSLRRIGSDLYAAWAEADGNGISQIHVARSVGDRWERSSTQLNTSPPVYSTTPYLASLGENLYVAWKEVSQNGLFQIMVKSGRVP